MGSGKTLICLSLVVSTLHQPVLPNPSAHHISRTTTDRALRTYPFEYERALRQLTGPYQQTGGSRIPTLGELCRHVATTGGIRRQPTALTIRNRRRIKEYPFFYRLPHRQPRGRTCKRDSILTEAKKCFLVNTTLAVVPSILVQQWRAEAEMHLTAGAVRFMAITRREEFSNIDEMITYDVGVRIGETRRPLTIS